MAGKVGWSGGPRGGGVAGSVGAGSGSVGDGQCRVLKGAGWPGGDGGGTHAHTARKGVCMTEQRMCS